MNLYAVEISARFLKGEEMMEKVAVHVEDMTMAYREQPVLWDIDLDIAEASRTAIIGPNGAGKSTMMKGILNLMKPLSGKVEILGVPYHKVYRKIAYIPQTSSVNWDFPSTVEDVVLMGRYVHLGWIKRPSKEDRRLAKEALEKMEMLDYSDRQISQLSGGQKQRVFVARALAQDATLYFMDEPLQGVDMKTEAVIMSVIREFQQQGKTVIAVHHDLNTVRDYFDHVVILNKKLVASGRVEEVFTKENIERAYASRVGGENELADI